MEEHEIQSPELAQIEKGAGKRERDWNSEQNKTFLLITDWFREAFMELKTGFFDILKVLYYLTKTML